MKGANEIAALSLLGETRFRLIARLFISPDRRYYQQQLVELTDTGQGAVQRELASLSELGILLRTREGRQIYFQANVRHPLYPELRGIAIKGTSVEAAISQCLEPLAEEINMALLYGSAARPTPGKLGDIELLVVASLSYGEVMGKLQDLQKYLGREIRPTILPEPEFKARLKGRDAFLVGVMKEGRRLVSGSPLSRVARS